MKKPAEIPTEAGTFALVHIPTKKVYVGKCANLRHRAAIWDHNFRKDMNKLPIKGLPTGGVPEDWEFMFWTMTPPKTVQAIMAKAGHILVNDTIRSRDILTYEGKTGTLADLARHFGIPYTMAYYRRVAGKPLDEVFAKPDFRKI